MNVSCPNCGKQLKFSEKFKTTLEALKPEQKVRVKCTQCAQPFQVGRELLRKVEDALPERMRAPKKKAAAIKPPSPPDVSWLEEGVFEDQEVVEDIPLALILIPENCGREVITDAVEGIGYRVEVVESADVAIEKMEFVNYSSVILHDEFETEGLNGKFHKFMSQMSMSKRRYILYALIGKKLNTFYDLEALAYSANIVVNEKDIPNYKVILRKAIPEYEFLFGPLMEEMRVLGK